MTTTARDSCIHCAILVKCCCYIYLLCNCHIQSVLFSFFSHQSSLLLLV